MEKVLDRLGKRCVNCANRCPADDIPFDQFHARFALEQAGFFHAIKIVHLYAVARHGKVGKINTSVHMRVMKDALWVSVQHRKADVKIAALRLRLPQQPRHVGPIMHAELRKYLLDVVARRVHRHAEFFGHLTVG